MWENGTKWFCNNQNLAQSLVTLSNLAGLHQAIYNGTKIKIPNLNLVLGTKSYVNCGETFRLYGECYLLSLHTLPKSIYIQQQFHTITVVITFVLYCVGDGY